MVERNAGLPPERRIEFRVGIHLGDVVEESDGDLMGDGVNIAARLEGIAKPGAICLSEDAYRQVKSRLDLAVSDLGSTQLKNIAEPVHVYSVEVGKPARAKPIKAVARKRRSSFAPLGAGVVAVMIVAAGAWYLFGASRPATDKAIDWAQRAILANPNIAFPYTALAAALALSARETEARDVIQHYRALPHSGLTIAAAKALKAMYQNPQSNPRAIDLWDRWIEGLRKAGLPEE